MADVATLSFAIDSKPLAQANTELSKMPAAAGGAQRAVDNLNKSTKELEKTNVTAAQNATRRLGQYDAVAMAAYHAARATTSTTQAAREATTATGAATRAVIAQTAASAAAQRVVSSHTVTTAAAAAVARTAANDNVALAGSMLKLVGVYKLIGAAAGVVASVLSIRSFIKETESVDDAFKTLGETWSATFDIGKQAATPLRNAIEDLTIAIENPAFTGFIQLIGRVLFAALTLAVKGVTLLVEGFSWLIDNIKAVSVVIFPALRALDLIAQLFETVFGVDLFDIIKKSINYLIGSFVAAYGDIKFLWENFPDVIGGAFVGAVNAAIRGINVMVTTAAEGINKVIDIANKVNPFKQIPKVGTGDVLPEMDNPSAKRLAGAAATRGTQQQQELSRDYLGEAGNYLTNGLGRRRITDTPPDKDKPGGGGADPYAKAVEYAKEYTLAKNAETAAVGQTAEAASRLKHEQELLNKAQTEGKTVTEAQRATLKSLAADMAAADSALAVAKFQNDNKTKTAEFLAGQQLERDALFMSREAAAAARFEYEMLNDAKQKGIDQVPGVIEGIKQEAAERAASQEKTRRYTEAVQLAKDVTSGFMSDINRGIREGANVWEIFGTAAENALTKISDKLTQMAIDQLFENAFPKSGGGGSGGGIVDFLGSIFSSAASSGAGSTFANGAAFRAGNVVPFAAGGIVGSPSMFPMAGGRTGLMGEAGPEAVMPLKRGPGGRLGVQASGGGGGGRVIITVTGDTDLVRVTARDEANQAVAVAGPRIEASAVKKAGRQVVPMVERNKREREGDYRA